MLLLARRDCHVRSVVGPKFREIASFVVSSPQLALQRDVLPRDRLYAVCRHGETRILKWSVGTSARFHRRVSNVRPAKVEGDENVGAIRHGARQYTERVASEADELIPVRAFRCGGLL